MIDLEPSQVRKVQNYYVYVQTEGAADYSRWLSLSMRDAEECQIHLQDLCHPGRISHLTSVNCPLWMLDSFLAYGPVQITAPTGYLLLRRQGTLASLEFRSLDDVSVTKVSVKLEDLKASLDAVRSEARVPAH